MLTVLCVPELGAQCTEIEDVARSLEPVTSRLDDIALTVKIKTTTFQRTVELRLIGRPAWQLWWLALDGRKDGRADFRILSFDGRFYHSLSADGLGACVSEFNPPDAYMSYAGISLSCMGLGPEEEGSGRNWISLLRSNRDFSLEDCPNEPGVVRLSDGHWTRYLAAQYGFMPVRMERGPSVRFDLSEYQEYGHIWLPGHIRRSGDQSFEECVCDVHINQGLGVADTAISYPFGTSVLYDQDVTRVFGTADLREAEEGLQNWLGYFGRFGRAEYNVAPIADQATIVAEPGARPYLISGLTLIGLGQLLPSLRRRARRGIAAAVLLGVCLAPRPGFAAEPESELLGESPSACFCTYIVGALYGCPVQLPDLTDHFASRQASSSLGKIAATLGEWGVYTQTAWLALDKLESWPYPVVLRLRSRDAMPYVRFAVLTGVNELGYTLVDPNRYGQLQPVTRERLLDLWSGQVLLTSPVPIRIQDPWQILTYTAVAFLVVCIVVFGWRSARRHRHAAALAGAVGLLFVVGCGRDAPKETPIQGTRTARHLDTRTWDAGEIYPESVRQEFALSNTTSQSLTVLKVSPSCGCMTGYLPQGLQLAPQTSQEFTLSIDFSGDAGPVTHTLRFEYSDGTAESLQVTAYVKRGVYPDPAKLTFESQEPGERIARELRLLCDDGQPFEIIGAEAPLAQSVTFAPGATSIFVVMYNNNDTTMLTDTLTIETSHPRSKSIRVPLIAYYALTWDTRPSGFFFHEGDGEEYVERTVTVVSKREIPFVVMAAAADGLTVEPLAQESAPSQDVRIRLRRPHALGAPKRELVSLNTTLPDAPVVNVSFIFYK